MYNAEKFSIKECFSKCYQICRKLWISSHLLKKFLMENFIFCAVFPSASYIRSIDHIQYFRRDNFWSLLLHFRVHIYSQKVTAKMLCNRNFNKTISVRVSFPYVRNFSSWFIQPLHLYTGAIFNSNSGKILLKYWYQYWRGRGGGVS